jgi:hypothetical protein
MRFKLFAVLALAATPAFANTTLFTKYENVRQGLLKQSLEDVHSSAKALSAAAKAAKNAEIQQAADAVAKSADLKVARTAFGPLSDEMIKVRDAAEDEKKPAVAFCPMVNKSWLQARGEIGNPYDPAMAKCGMFKK